MYLWEEMWLILTSDIRKSFGNNFPPSERGYKNSSFLSTLFISTLYTALLKHVAWGLCDHLVTMKKSRGTFRDAHS